MQQLPGKKSKIFLQFFFRKHPTIPFILKWLLISVLIGACIGSASAGFLFSLEWATAFRENHLWLIALLPIGGFGIGALYHYYGKEAEAGNNLVIDTILEPKQTIPFRMAPFVYLGTIVTHLFGGSAGREGTALQMAGALADQFSKPFRLSRSERSVLIIAAVAGGFGSVFGTPLAGAFFALEFYLIGRIRYHALFPALLTAVFADGTAKLWGVHHTQYPVHFLTDNSFLNVLYAIVAGIIFGWCAAIFSTAMRKTTHLFKSNIKFPPLRPFLGGILVAVAVVIIGNTKYIGLGIPIIVDAFTEPQPLYSFALKMLFTIVTLSAGFKGGEVTPLFFIGATLGSALSYFIPLPISLLAAMGFVAVFSGATNTPVACSIMAVELFGAESGIFAAIACVAAYLASGHTGIYGQQMIGNPKNKRFARDENKRLNDL